MSDALRLFDKESERIWSLVEANLDHLHTPARDDQYSIWDIATHIVTASQGVILVGLTQVQPNIDWQIPGGDDFNLDAWNHEQMLAWRNRSLADLKTEWQSVRPLFEQFLAANQPDLEITHPMGLKMNYNDYAALITGHMRMHRLDIENGLNAIKNEEPAS